MAGSSDARFSDGFAKRRVTSPWKKPDHGVLLECRTRHSASRVGGWWHSVSGCQSIPGKQDDSILPAANISGGRFPPEELLALHEHDGRASYEACSAYEYDFGCMWFWQLQPLHYDTHPVHPGTSQEDLLGLILFMQTSCVPRYTR